MDLTTLEQTLLDVIMFTNYNKQFHTRIGLLSPTTEVRTDVEVVSQRTP